jgi:hypothetical protein
MEEFEIVLVRLWIDQWCYMWFLDNAMTWNRCWPFYSNWPILKNDWKMFQESGWVFMYIRMDGYIFYYILSLTSFFQSLFIFYLFSWAKHSLESGRSPNTLSPSLGHRLEVLDSGGSLAHHPGWYRSVQCALIGKHAVYVIRPREYCILYTLW